MTDAHLLDRCENWGRVVRARLTHVAAEGTGKHRRYWAKIGSYEAGYRSPQSHHWTPPVTASFELLDVVDADDVESAVCMLEMYPHVILRGWHVNRLSEPMCLRLAARAAGVMRGKVSGWGPTLEMAYALLSEALTTPRALRRERARQRVHAALGDAGNNS